MGAIALSRRLALMLACLISLDAADQADLLEPVSYVATALTNDDSSDAMKPFDKQMPDYDRIKRCFAGLMDRGLLSNKITVIRDESSGDTATLVLNWTLTIESRLDPVSNERRQREVTVKLKHEKKGWKIVSFSPIDLFEPSQAMQ